MEPVLVTGADGKVGRAVVARLEATGHRVKQLDLGLGLDLRSETDVAKAMVGVRAVVHAGALAHDWAGTPAEIVATNLLGTWHVLLAAEREQVRRVVYFSSAQVFGFADGESDPAYLPVDDDHPLRATRPYGMSKRLAEDMCEAWSRRTGIDTVVLRPVMILEDGDPRLLREDVAQLGAYVHLDDVVDASILALDSEVPPHSRMTLCGPGEFDTSRAANVLGWRAQHGWP
jgi:nucleoside-diphosphate-sugar epimerase